jgi:hypothetical protein
VLYAPGPGTFFFSSSYLYFIIIVYFGPSVLFEVFKYEPGPGVISLSLEISVFSPKLIEATFAF